MSKKIYSTNVSRYALVETINALENNLKVSNVDVVLDNGDLVVVFEYDA